MIAVKKWILNPQGDKEMILSISRQMGLSAVVSNLLVQRGVDTVDKVHKFFNPQLSDLYDPFLMKDMDKAVLRLEQAIRNNEKIMVYGDYDVDGTTAVALMYSFINYKLGHPNVQFYIPDRYDEGYGISRKSIEYSKDCNVKLIIALDCGVKAVEEVAYAKSLGMDFVICDHHLQGEFLPDAVAILDPKRLDCQYPFDELSGCGVGFKLAQGYAQKNNIPFEKVAGLLDLLVVSIASDIVSITGENRILAYHGLQKLTREPIFGLKTILKTCELVGQVISIDDIVFKVGPRINAAGRMANCATGSSSGGNNAVKLMISRNKEDADKYVKIVDNRNSDRKEVDRSITVEALDLVKSDPLFDERKCTVIYNPNWMKGVLGIVASRLIEKYYRPTVVLTETDGLISGSARSVAGFDLYQAVESCADLLENFGGHTYAAGMTMKKENYEKFKERFENYVNVNISDEMLISHIDIDCEIDINDVNSALMRDLSKFHPFGPGNTRPVFRSRKLNDAGQGRPVGREGEHLKLDVIGCQMGKSVPAIGFGLSAYADTTLKGHAFDMCYALTENTYRGVAKLQLRIKDIKESNSFDTNETIDKLYCLFEQCGNISTDSRNLEQYMQRGEKVLFFALKGDNFDGNEFVEKALINGATYCVSDLHDYYNNPNVVVVNNVLDVLKRLSSYHRSQLKAKVIAITGSNGKTTTKELLNNVLSQKYCVSSTVGNLNNHIGVPLTLLSIPKECEIAIVEMGASHIGEIAELCEIAKPDYGIVTNIGKAHLEGFGSIEGVAKAKGEMVKYLADSGGIFFCNDNCSFMSSIVESSVFCSSKDVLNYSVENVKIEESEKGELIVVDTFAVYKTQLFGEYNKFNVMAAVAIGKYFNVPDADIASSIEAYKPTNKRSQLIDSSRNIIILDTYNANPSSMESALSNFHNFEGKNKVIILGDMKELGSHTLHEHIAVLKLVDKMTLDRVILVGNYFREALGRYPIAADWSENAELLLKELESKPVDKATILIKGSNSMTLDIVISTLI